MTRTRHQLSAGSPLRNPLIAAAGTAGYGPEIDEVDPGRPLRGDHHQVHHPGVPRRESALAGHRPAGGDAERHRAREPRARTVPRRGHCPPSPAIDTVMIGSIAGHSHRRLRGGRRRVRCADRRRRSATRGVERLLPEHFATGTPARGSDPPDLASLEVVCGREGGAGLQADAGQALTGRIRRIARGSRSPRSERAPTA